MSKNDLEIEAFLKVFKKANVWRPVILLKYFTYKKMSFAYKERTIKK